MKVFSRKSIKNPSRESSVSKDMLKNAEMKNGSAVHERGVLK